MSPRSFTERSFFYSAVVSSCSMIAFTLFPNSMVADDHVADVERGRHFFEHRWQIKDDLSPSGDGLGPLHNASSCVECHHQGGVGGAGPVTKNVELLAVASTRSSDKKNAAMRSQLERLHPVFMNGPNMVLHKRSTFPEYDLFRLRFLGAKFPNNISDADKVRLESKFTERQNSHPSPIKFDRCGIEFQLSQRNTPALFGLSLIDSIPSEEIQFEAIRQSATFSDVKGRVAIPNSEPIVARLKFKQPVEVPKKGLRVGRFGWRGQMASLREFVLGACANELGLEVPTNVQPMNPLGPSYKAPGVDLTSEQCDTLVAFVASLPRPMQIKPDDPDAAALVDSGERLFREIGCAMCHKPQMGDVDGLYSDLLLHDMGPHLTDFVPVNSSDPARRSSSGGGYSGGGSIEFLALAPIADRQSWRTTPLWGVRDSGPYLHDGRARTLREAITLHGGEAKSARTDFLRLSMSQQANIISFLETLAAPSTSSLVDELAAN